MGPSEKSEERVYAIVQTGGRQFRMEPDKTLKIPKVETAVGETLELDSVLLIHGDSGVSVGKPQLEGAKVVAEVVDQGRDPKILVFHKKRRKRYQKKRGHRQPFTEIRVKEILSA